MKHLEKFNKVIAIMTMVSFIIGTLFIVSFAIFKELEIAVAGYLYLWIAVAINLIAFIAKIIYLFIYKKDVCQSLKILGIQLLNIPIAAFYFYLFTTIV